MKRAIPLKQATRKASMNLDLYTAQNELAGLLALRDEIDGRIRRAQERLARMGAPAAAAPVGLASMTKPPDETAPRPAPASKKTGRKASVRAAGRSSDLRASRSEDVDLSDMAAKD